jgi:hypothetical protein
VLNHEDKIASSAPTLDDTVDCAAPDQRTPESLCPDVPAQLGNLPATRKPCEERARGARADAASSMAPQHEELADHADTRAREVRTLAHEGEARQAAVRADDEVACATPRLKAAVPAPAAVRPVPFDPPPIPDEVVDVELHQAAH